MLTYRMYKNQFVYQFCTLGALRLYILYTYIHWVTSSLHPIFSFDLYINIDMVSLSLLPFLFVYIFNSPSSIWMLLNLLTYSVHRRIHMVTSSVFASLPSVNLFWTSKTMWWPILYAHLTLVSYFVHAAAPLSLSISLSGDLEYTITHLVMGVSSWCNG